MNLQKLVCNIVFPFLPIILSCSPWYSCPTDSMVQVPSQKMSKLLRFLLPPCVILYMAYAEWAFSYLFCYSHVYRGSHNKPSMISFLVIANILWFVAISSWVFIFLKGPGGLPYKIPPYDLSRFVHEGEKLSTIKDQYVSCQESYISPESSNITLNNHTISPPAIFECDYNGLPFWCSKCSTLKLLRSHHSSIRDHCIPMFDHFCTFVGSTIGKDNFAFFIYFVFSLETLMCFTSITIIVYSGIWNQLHAAFIVFLIVTGLMAILIGNLVFNTLGDIYQGETTIERLERVRWRKSISKSQHGENVPDELKKFVNVQHPTEKNLRLLVPLTPSDKPYNNGFKRNLKLWFQHFSMLQNPQQVSEFQYSLFSEQFKKSIKERITNGNYVVFGSQAKLHSVNV